MRYFVRCMYNGSAYSGWQVQPGKKTIQEVIEKQLSKILNNKTTIYSSGRTDAGVSALDQAFHFDSVKKINDVDLFKYSLNRILPCDIRLISIEVVDDAFNARFSSKKKTYEYTYYFGEAIPFNYQNSHIIYKRPDVSIMKEAAKLFIGKHCFKNFTTKEEDEKKYVRTIFNASIVEKESFIKFTVSGDGFMRYMVRLIAGELLAVGQNKKTIEEVKNMLDANSMTKAKYKLPPEGLLLKEVNYDK